MKEIDTRRVWELNYFMSSSSNCGETGAGKHPGRQLVTPISAHSCHIIKRDSNYHYVVAAN